MQYINPSDPFQNTDHKDKYNREFSSLPDAVLKIKSLTDALDIMLSQPNSHPMATGHIQRARQLLQEAKDILDRAAHQLHLAANL